MPDFELIKKINQNDDQEAFKTIIEKYKQLVFGIAIGFFHDNETANDIVQDVFIKFWQIRKDFELKSKFSTWLYKVTTNHCVNVQRRKKIITAFSFLSSKNSEDKNLEQKLLQNTKMPEKDSFREEHIKNALNKAINSLPKRQRIAFILNKYQNFSYKDISEIMDLSVSSVESLLHRAKTNLQEKLSDTYKNLNN